MSGKRASIGLRLVALVVTCITFAVLVGTGQMRFPARTADEQPALAASSEDAARASIDTTRVREALEAIGLTDVPENIIATLSTLEKIDDYPIYTIRYFGPYIRASELATTHGSPNTRREDEPAWACSLFAAVGNPDRPMFGRNFDWEHSPILVVFLEPEEGHRSVMSIDLAYLVEEAVVDRLDTAPVEELLPLLDAPFLTFDGMNDAGLAIGMASVDYECGYPTDPGKRDVGDLLLMREVLESSPTVDDALAFLEGINPVSQGGPNSHYLIADRTPAAALVEYHDGEMYVFRSSPETPWQLGTNFPVVLTEGNPSGHCWRYDRIEETLRETGGDLSAAGAMELLRAVSTAMTQWSIVYDLTKLTMHLNVDRRHGKAFTFSVNDGA